MTDRAAALAALADPVRRQLLDLLADRGPQTASKLAGSFDITRQAVSKHLAQLEESGLIHRASAGRSVLFSVDPAALRETAAWLSRTTRRWEERLDRLSVMLDASE